MGKIITHNIVTFLFLLFTCLPYVHAQQDAQFSNNMFNQLFYNPGFAGSNERICLTMLNRMQWIGFSETNPQGEKYKVNPQTFLFSVDANINALRGGLGAVIYNDKLGHENNVGVKFGYAYRRYLRDGKIGIGLMAGFLNKTINYAGFFPIHVDDPLLAGGGEESDMIFDISGGVFYKVPGKYYLGMSSSQLLQSESDFGVFASPQLKRHYYITGGYYYTFPANPSVEFWPSALIKTEFVTMQIDVNCLFMWNQQLWGGLGYRSVDAVVFLAGGRPIPSQEDLWIGIAYDFTTSSMRTQGKSMGSAEVFINYCFKIEYTPPVSSYKNVRFL